jgi:very-short-patch-repair endonuclease
MTQLHRHAVRRAQGIPTVSVLSGPPALGMRAWSRSLGERSSAALDEWPAAAQALVAKRGHELDVRLAALGIEDVAACRALLETGQAAVATIATIATLARALGDGAPAIHVFPRDAASIAELAPLAPALPAALIVEPPALVQLLSTAQPRSAALLREGTIAVESLGEASIGARLAAGGLDPAPLAGAIQRLASDGAGEELVELFATAASDRARSSAEAFLFARLDTLPATAGLFELNRRVAGHEIDLWSERAGVAVELDGWYHFQDPEQYRRDRTKDRDLQREQILVLRFLAGDVVARLEEILDTIVDAVAFALEQKR